MATLVVEIASEGAAGQLGYELKNFKLCVMKEIDSGQDMFTVLLLICRLWKCCGQDMFTVLLLMYRLWKCCGQDMFTVLLLMYRLWKCCGQDMLTVLLLMYRL